MLRGDGEVVSTDTPSGRCRGVHRWMRHHSGTTSCRSCWAGAEWARSIRPTTPGPTASSRSRSCPITWPRTRSSSSAFAANRRPPPGVNDPHVVPIHGFGEIDGRLYLDMRLIDGRTLGDHARRERQGAAVARRYAVSVVEQVADGAGRRPRGRPDPPGRQAVEHPDDGARLRLPDRLRARPHRQARQA